MGGMVTAMDMVKDTVINLLLKEVTNLTTATIITTQTTLDMGGMGLQLMQDTETPTITKVTVSKLRPLRTNSLEEKLQAQLKHKPHTSRINYCLV